MGIFTQRQTTYTPPLDGTKPGPTLVGGQADQAASPESETQLSTELGTSTLPPRANGDWENPAPRFSDHRPSEPRSPGSGRTRRQDQCGTEWPVEFSQLRQE